MARRRRTKTVSPLEFLREQRNSLSPLGDLRSMLADFSNRAPSGRKQDLPPESEWIGGLKYIVQMASEAQRKKAAPIKVQVTHIGDDSYVRGRCHDRGKKCRPKLMCDAEEMLVDASCSCNISQKTESGICCHVVALATYVLKHMEDPDSELRRRILDEIGLQGENIARPGEFALSVLDQFILDSESAEPADDPLSAKHADERLLWELQFDRKLHISTRIQKRKKRGDGWTKGRTIRPETLSHGNYALSPTDLQCLQHLKREYFYGDYGWDKFKLLETLIGHDHVELNGEPASIRRIPFALRVDRDTALGHFKLQLDPTPKAVELHQAGFISCDVASQTIYLCEATAEQKNLARTILENEITVPEQRFDELMERIRPLSRAVTVQLPDDLVESRRIVEVQPVLKLLSRKDGHLQCGLRVKDAHRLFRPGEGVLVRYESTNGKQSQIRRDPDAELACCRSVTRGLGLDQAQPVGDWEWRFTEFPQTLDFLERLENAGPDLGVEALWDDESEDPVRIIGSISANNVRVEVKRKKDWFGIEGGFTLGNHEFSLPELLAAVDSEPAKGYAEIRPGMWAKITDRLRKRLAELRDAAHLNRTQLQIDATAVPIIQRLQESELEINAVREWQDCVRRLESSEKLRPTPSKDFKAELRDYQKDGYCWMRRLAEWGVGGCLADDMGLGKTVQALAVLVDRAKEGPTLVIAPTSVGFNWQRETERFAPTLKPHLYRETERERFLDDLQESDIVICSYGLALRDAQALAKVQWGTLILDEAQFIKNARSKTALAIRTIPAKWKLALTGTPMENHLGELWSLFRTISPGVFGSWEQFRKRFAAPIERNNDAARRVALSHRIQPFVLRRTKAEVLTDLPPRTEINLYVDLSPAERERYDEMRLAAVGELNDIAGLPDTNDQRFKILAILTRLRQLACHVGLVDENWKEESSKLAMLVETVNELKDEGHRVLIFSQFTKYLTLIRKAMDDNKISYEYLDGKTTAKARQERVDRFQEGKTDAFLISLKAGGTGLNLTAADYVIHMDPWWNPAVEDQATDRSHRIGQDRPVIVYRIIAKGTVEDQILSLHADKRDLVSSVMDGTQKAARMSTNELLDLIRG